MTDFDLQASFHCPVDDYRYKEVPPTPHSLLEHICAETDHAPTVGMFQPKLAVGQFKQELVP